MNELQKKLGPLKLWQWIVIGGGTGIAVYWYKKSHGEAANPEVNPEAEEKLLGALRAGGGGGGGEGAGVGAPAPLDGLEGPAGVAGPAGPPGEAAPLPTPLAENDLVGHQLLHNNPPSLAHNTAPKVNPQHLTRNPANGEMYRTVHKGGKTIHEYPHRKGPNKSVVIGGKGHGKPTGHAAKPHKAKPKPVPIHRRVTVHAAPPHRAAPKPVTHKPAKPPARKRR
jgi:hypothetical protein